MKSVASYWALVLVTAFRHSVNLAQAVTFGMFIALGVFGAAFPVVRRSMRALGVDMGGWQFAAICFGAVIVARLLLAPHWIYQEQLNSIADLKNMLKDRLSKKQIRERVADFIDQGRVFLLVIVRDGRVPEELGAWDQRVRQWLKENLDASYATKFVTARTHPEPPVGLGSEHLRINWIGTRFRLDNLGQIMDEIR